LASFCDQSQQIISDELIKFNAQQFITRDVMALNLFKSQAKSFIQLFISSTERSFMRSIELVRELTQGNVLFPGLSGNLQFKIVIDNDENVLLTTYYVTLDSKSSNCSCQQTSTCVQPAAVFYNMSYAPTPVIRYVVPGIMRGCYILEAFLQSNLVCFYNQSCIDDLHWVLNITTPLARIIELNTTALNPSLLSQFQVNTTFANIIDVLMVEEWITNYSHTNYYTACNPKTCTYSIVGKNHVIVVISSTIGLLGGLKTILIIIVPVIVRKIRLCFKNRANGTVEEEEHPTPIPTRHIF
jgi:hypothetical protein